MAAVVRMPSVLAGATEAAIAHWLVSPGDTVAVGTPIAEIETEKALVEYAAEEAGVVGRLVLGEGDSGEIGDPIAVLVAAGETDADIDAALGVSSPPAAAAAAPPAPGSAVTANAPPPSASVPTGAAVPTGEAVPTGGRALGSNGHQATAGGGRIFASPLVRKLAGERGIDLAGLAGTGPNGRIVRRDLERFLAAGPAAPSRPAAALAGPQAVTAAASAQAAAAPSALAVPGGAMARGEAEPAIVRDNAFSVSPAAGGGTSPAGGSLIPHTPMRRAIARRLTESKATVPHFYMTAEPVVDELLALRKRVNEALPSNGPGAVRVSVNDFVVAAVAAAFCDVPEANVTWSDEGLVAYRSVDISIAVATETGLVTPVLRGVEGKKLSAIASESAALAQRARDRKLLQHELEGGTFAVSNLGMYGTVEFSAIINPPQSGILAVGAARSQPVAVDGEVRVATVMRCTLSVDHRAIDGALAARWLAAFTARLENPLGALA
jgi:pyruvate dehydrogenase E2 component (dihydrolipoamide acetyltransferase)